METHKEKFAELEKRISGRIIAMGQWDADYINAEGPGLVTIDDDETGEFHFGHVHGTIDYEIVPIQDGQRLDFSWVIFAGFAEE